MIELGHALVCLARILIVDDEPDNRTLLEIILTREGFTTMSACCGEDALECVLRSPPNLVLLDVMMPGMSGYDVSVRLRANRATERIPILIMSAASDGRSRVRAQAAGADDFLAKPVERRLLCARVKELLRDRASRAT